MAATWARYRASSLAVLGADTWTRISSMYWLFVVFDLDGVVSRVSCLDSSMEDDERPGPIGVFVSPQCDGRLMQRLLNCGLASRSLDIEIDILLTLKMMDEAVDHSIIVCIEDSIDDDDVVLAILVRA